MPKSKRENKVSLTKTKKKGLELKEELISDIRGCLDEYENVFIISIFNQRNNYLKELRYSWSHSRFVFGKNKVVSLAFGRKPESEYKSQLHQLCPYLAGNVGLLFTNKTKEEVLKFFEDYSCPDYARSGNIAAEDVIIQAGPLEQFQHTMEPQLRQLGMHTSLKRGIVTLDTDFQICKVGDKLTPEQARLLKLFEIMQAKFKVNVRAYWNKNGKLEVFQKDENNNNEKIDEDGSAAAAANDDDDDDDEEEEEPETDDEEEKKIKKKQKKF